MFILVPVCEQPVDISFCRMNDRRWFYNKDTQKCEEFVFGGCNRNENNFLTKQACEARCPGWHYIFGQIFKFQIL